MKKAEEAAQKAYPVDMDYRLINGAEHGKRDRNISERLAYVKGYRQALEDMREELIPRLLPTIRDKSHDDWEEGRHTAFVDIINFIDEQSK